MTSSPTPITVPAGHGKAVRLTAGQAVRVVNTHGTQVVDCWALNAYDLSEYMCMETTRVWNQRLNPIVGDTFVTNQRHPILTLVEDTTPGVHDTFMAACDRKRYELLGVRGYHRNCCDNMFEGMFELGGSVIAASGSLSGETAGPPQLFKPPQLRTTMPVEQRITAATSTKTAQAWRSPHPDRSIFNRRAMKGPQLSVGKLGWPNGVPRIAILDAELRKPMSSARSRISVLKPIVMPRITVAIMPPESNQR